MVNNKKLYTPPRPKMISKKNWSAKRTMLSYLKKLNENQNIKEKKRSWKPFIIYLPSSTANLTQFG